MCRRSVLHFFLNQTQHFGKQMRACPNAWWDDGLFDMEWISNKRRGEVVRIFDLIKDGRHGSLVQSRQAKKCLLQMEDDEGLFNVDGEVVRYKVARSTSSALLGPSDCSRNHHAEDRTNSDASVYATELAINHLSGCFSS